MASNKELMSDITTLCNERGVAVPDGLDELKNPKLVELLDSLQKQAPPSAPPAVVETPLRPLVAPSPPEDGDSDDAKAPPPSSAAPEVAPPAPQALAPVPVVRAAEPTGARGFYVAAGKTVTTLKREVQGAYEQVFATDFAEGQAQLDAYVASGYLFKR